MSEGFEGKSDGAFFFKFGAITLVVLLFVSYFVFNGGGGSQETTGALSVKDGEVGVTTNDTYIATNKEAFDELTSYFNARNTEGLRDLESAGLTVFVSKGTEVTVIDRGLLKTKIKINATGKRGYITTGLVTK